MKINTVEDFAMYTLEEEDRERKKRMGFKNWVNLGDFFSHLLAGATPTATLAQLTEDECGHTVGVKMVPLLAALKIIEKINRDGISTRASRVVEIFQEYLIAYAKELEADYETDREEEGSENKEKRNKDEVKEEDEMKDKEGNSEKGERIAFGSQVNSHKRRKEPVP
jgi:hypothetical protein